MDVLCNIIGLAGTVMMLYAYWLQQKDDVMPDAPHYLWLNFAGALAVIISLCRFFNLASFLLELAWLAISMYGLLKIHGKLPVRKHGL